MKKGIFNWRQRWMENRRLLGLLGLCCLVLFAPYLLNQRMFLFSADQQLQYNFFYGEWLEMIERMLNTHQFPFYSWNTFLGNNFYAAKAYYVTGDIFLPVIYLFRNHYTEIGTRHPETSASKQEKELTRKHYSISWKIPRPMRRV